ncbi:MAG: phospholipase D/Transphosphatidylase [Pedosphaera sp.]|nr:phospholipase D/Transphosphatidylase [Pedosphaera sp.]
MLLATIVFLTGCGSLPKPRPEWSERRPVDTQGTTWAQTVAPQAAEHPGSSGVELVRYGLDALSARLALIDTAERTLDLQYYIWLPDSVGQLLAERVLSAADRGVRVRILLDDIGGTASDKVLLAMNAHTNVEVRIFNPIANRRFRKVSSLLEFGRVNRRMHNKSFTADTTVTILGGRNIAEGYFAVGEDTRFVDYEVIAAGPAVKDVAKMFERYWYSPSAIPIQALNPKKEISPAKLAEARANLTEKVNVTTNLPGFKVVRASDVGAAVSRHDLPLEWGPVRLLSDLPEKVTTDPDDPSTHLLPALRAEVDKTTSELLLVSPYFVPGEKGVEYLRSLRRRGVRVVVLSNSLAANDVTPVHAGYRRYRKPLLRAGVEMWEIKPNVEIRVAKGQGAAPPQSKSGARSTLHAKSLIFDRKALFVGSFNLDPRSAALNTEMGLIIQIPDLAQTTAQALEEQLPQSAYRVEFVPGSGPCKECGHIVWLSQENGREVRYAHEPHATFSQRVKAFLYRFLPIESQL